MIRLEARRLSLESGKHGWRRRRRRLRRRQQVHHDSLAPLMQLMHSLPVIAV